MGAAPYGGGVDGANPRARERGANISGGDENFEVSKRGGGETKFT